MTKIEIILAERIMVKKNDAILLNVPKGLARDMADEIKLLLKALLQSEINYWLENCVDLEIEGGE
ncbi:MAG: hypothetical protein ACXQTI_00340 [Candidatus Nezhaarchaeales archaeon]